MFNFFRVCFVPLVFALPVAGCGERDTQVSDVASGLAAADASDKVSFESASMPVDAKPTFDCSQELSSSIEQLICKDKGLASLDQQMAEVFKAASETGKAQQDRYFKARQRGWIKGRNDCWKADDKRACTEESYLRQIAELQARYALVPGRGPVTYICDGSEVIATYYETDPATAVANYNNEEKLLFVEPAASGARYRGPGISIWEHQGEAKITWGMDRPQMLCKVRS